MLDRFRVLASGLDHPEGVAVGPDGRIWAGGEGGQVYAVRDGHAEVVARTGGFVLGLALDGAGRLYVCDVGRGTVLRVETGIPEGTVGDAVPGASVVPYARFEDGGMAAPNWLAFAPDGALFVTDSGDWGRAEGRIWRLEPDGRAAVWTSEASRLPNGCCLDGDAKGLFVIETNLPGVVRVPIGPDGRAGRPSLVARLEGTVPDGLALLADGSLLVACYRPDAILRIDTTGRVEVVVEDPSGQLLGAPTNVAFAPGGAGRLDRLVVANLGRWHVVTGDLPFAGAPLPYPDLS